MLLEMLTVDSHWELDTVQLLKHICISGRREATRELGGPEPLSVGLQLTHALRMEFVGHST
jgi:hypothetical protein